MRVAGPDEGAGSAARRRRKTRPLRAALVVLATLVLAECLYLIGGNLYLRHGLLERLNAKPDRMQVSWSRAFTWWPGVVRVEDVVIRRQNRIAQWEARMDRGRARFGLLDLLFHRFDMSGLDGEGLVLRLRFVPKEGRGAERASPHAPTIEGFPKVLTPEDAEALPERVRRKRPWRFRFQRCRVESVREIWIGPFRYEGPGTVGISMDVIPRRRVEVPSFELKVDGQLSIGDDLFISDLAGTLACELDPFRLDERPALDVMEELSVRADLAGKLHDVQLPRGRFPRIPWLGFGGGTAQADVKLAIEDGSFADGTSILVTADDFEVSYPGYVVQGRARIEGAVGAEPGPHLVRLARLAATFEEFSIQKEGAAAAHVRGKGFEAELRTRDLTLRRPLETFEVELVLPRSEIVNFETYAATIPEPLRLKVESGTGDIEGRILVTQDGGSGSLLVDARDVVLEYQGERLRTNLQLRTNVKSADLDVDAPAFDLSGSELHVKDGAVVGGQGDERLSGWWADVVLDELQLRPKAAVAAEIRATAKLRDTRPLIAVMAADRPLLKLVRPALIGENVDITARLRGGPKLMDLETLELRGEGLVILACMDLRPSDRRGVVLVDSGAVSAGMKFAGERRNLKLFAKEPWFREMSPLCDDPEHFPPD